MIELLYAATGCFIGMAGSFVWCLIMLQKIHQGIDDIREGESLIRSRLFKSNVQETTYI